MIILPAAPPAPPLVSVICLAYKHASYIRQAMDGFLMQQTDFPFDIWVHDDASPDGTQQILREYARAHPDKIHLVLQSENQFSRGIKPLTKHLFPRLTSKYLAFCEGDDYWIDPGKLQRQAMALQADATLSLCVHDVQMRYEDGVPVKEQFYQKPKTGDFEFEFMDKLRQPFFSTATLMTRRELVLAQPKNFKSTAAGDLQLFFHLLSRGNGFYLDQAMTVKRRNPGGITLDPAYHAKAAEGIYELFHYIQPFAPESAKNVIRRKLAEFERQFVRTRRKIARYSLPQMAWQAFRNDPGWLWRTLARVDAPDVIRWK